MRDARVIADLDAVNNHMLIDHDGMLMRTETNWQPHAETIANARADGYNRGREVESARWEARDPDNRLLAKRLQSIIRNFDNVGITFGE